MEDKVLFEVVPNSQGGFNVCRPHTLLLTQFRNVRLNSIASGDTPVPLDGGPKIVLHILPISALETDATVDVKLLHNKDNEFKPLGSNDWDTRYNSLGIAALSKTNAGYDGYLQLFTDGTIETVSQGVFKEGKFFYGRSTEEKILRVFDQYKAISDIVGIELPWFAGISIVGARNCFLKEPDLIWTLDSDKITLQFARLESEDFGEQLRATFDRIWQSAGLPATTSYDDHGVRK